MSKGNNSPGVSRLAAAMDKLAKRNIPNDLIIDYGTILDDLSLLTNSYPIPIPKKDYLALRHLRKVPDDEIPKTEAANGPDEHTHKFQPHEPLKKGDRVLVAWVHNDAIVLDVIMLASDVLA